MPEHQARMTADEFDRLFESLKNWGRWGTDDERGTLNFVTARQVAAAAALVRSGRHVSLALPIRTEPDPENPRPALHHMTQTSDVGAGEPRWNQDFIGMDYHGESQTHLDAVCHCLYRGQMYNALPAESVTVRGASRAGLGVAEHGIVARGVLLDVPRLRGSLRSPGFGGTQARPWRFTNGEIVVSVPCPRVWARRLCRPRPAA